MSLQSRNILTIQTHMSNTISILYQTIHQTPSPIPFNFATSPPLHLNASSAAFQPPSQSCHQPSPSASLYTSITPVSSARISDAHYHIPQHQTVRSFNQRGSNFNSCVFPPAFRHLHCTKSSQSRSASCPPVPYPRRVCAACRSWPSISHRAPCRLDLNPPIIG